jgi:hypothetical protein
VYLEVLQHKPARVTSRPQISRTNRRYVSWESLSGDP